MSRSVDSVRRFEANRSAWNARTPVHMKSAYYDLDGFRAGAQSLRPPERQLAGDVGGKRILHLQCHFGLDTLSWARLGAKVTGVDACSASIDAAREIASELGIPATFVCADVQDLPPMDGPFDLAISTYGVTCWLEDLDAWARSIRKSVVPGGRFILVEFHPILETLYPGTVSGAHSYFGGEEPIGAKTKGTYTDRDAPIEYFEYRWQHSVSEVASALLGAGHLIREFREYDQCSYPLIDGLERNVDGMWASLDCERFPYMYALVTEITR